MLKLSEREIWRRDEFTRKRKAALSKGEGISPELGNAVRKLFLWGNEIQEFYGETEFIDKLSHLVWKTMGKP